MNHKLMEDVYDSLLGELIAPIPGVENAFAENQPCEQWYQEMQEAYERLRKRLNIPNEDHDIEAIITAMLSMQKELCFQMYKYGAMFAGISISSPK